MLNTSIIINTYNYPAALDCVLTEVIRQVSASSLPCEIIVADDGSGAPTQAIIDKHKIFFPELKHLWHEDIGFRRTVILNKAIVEAAGDYIIFLDGDCVPFPGFLTQHTALAESGYFVAGHRVLASQDFTQAYLCADKKPLSHFSFFNG